MFVFYNIYSFKLIKKEIHGISEDLPFCSLVGSWATLVQTLAYSGMVLNMSLILFFFL